MCIMYLNSFSFHVLCICVLNANIYIQGISINILCGYMPRDVIQILLYISLLHEHEIVAAIILFNLMISKNLTMKILSYLPSAKYVIRKFLHM